MSVKSAALRWKETVRWEQLLARQPVLLRALSLLTNFLLGFLGGSAVIFGRCGPFGAALTARSGGGTAGLCCALGASLGYVSALGLARGIRYAAASVLIYTVAFVCRELPLSRKAWFMSAVAAALMASTGALGYFDGGSAWEATADLLAESLLTMVSAFLFALALEERQPANEQEELRRVAGGVLLFGCLVMALCRAELLHIVSLGRLCAAFAVLICAFGGGAPAGCAAGLVLGVCVDLTGRGGPCYAVCYGFAGLMAGLFRHRGRLLLILGFLLSGAIMIFWSWSRIHSALALYELLVASVCFLLLPARGMTALTAALRPVAAGGGESGARRYAARRAQELADAFRELYETVRQSAAGEGNDENMAAIYDRAAESVCAQCRLKGECWHRDYLDTLSVLNDATAAMRRRGRLEREDLPPRFTERCEHTDAFLDAVNAEMRAHTYRRRLRARLEENRAAAYGQYRYLAGVLDAVAEELRCSVGADMLAERRLQRYLNSLGLDAQVSVFRDRTGRLRLSVESDRLSLLYRTPGYMDRMSALLGVRLCRPGYANREEGRLVLLEAEPLSVSVGVAAMRKEGESVSGDRGTYFKTEQGVLCVLLSDGMGSGEAAAKESVSTVRILERFLRAGVEPATAMKILNSVMLLKNGEEWGYATVDLMCIDLFTGQAGFYKYGAAPSYIRSGRGVRRVKGISLAAGILAGEGESPDMVRMTLKPGGLALIASDGVVAQQEDGWLREMLRSFEGNDTKELARQVLREAERLYGGTDDMTVLAVRVEERK